MTLQCVKFLACKLVLNSCFVSHKANFSVTELTSHPIPLPVGFGFFPSFLPSKFRSFLFILSRCQGHPLSYLASARFLPQVCVISYADFHPICFSGPLGTHAKYCSGYVSYLLMWTLISLLCSADLCPPWHGSSSSPFTTITNFVIF